MVVIAEAAPAALAGANTGRPQAQAPSSLSVGLGQLAGASAPEHLVQELIAFLSEYGYREMEEVELVDEDVRFSLPAELTITIQ